jgi:hypothetical protein
MQSLRELPTLLAEEEAVAARLRQRTLLVQRAALVAVEDLMMPTVPAAAAVAARLEEMD